MKVADAWGPNCQQVKFRNFVAQSTLLRSFDWSPSNSVSFSDTMALTSRNHYWKVCLFGWLISCWKLLKMEALWKRQSLWGILKLELRRGSKQMFLKMTHDAGFDLEENACWELLAHIWRIKCHCVRPWTISKEHFEQSSFRMYNQLNQTNEMRSFLCFMSQ